MRLKPFLFLILSIKASLYTYGQVRIPKEESHLESFDPSVNQLNFLFSRFPQYNGLGITISIKEQKVDSGDIDFKGRFKTSSIASDFITTHASQMATLSAGGGNTSDKSKGAAWKAWISSSSFLNLMPDPDSYFKDANISIQNHSYGTGIEPEYAEDAAAYDALANRRKALLHVFSAGNLGDQPTNSGRYSGLYFGNLSGSFKMSKNSLSVGSVDGHLTVAEKSSRGPAYDGRIKPELVAYGLDGSSGAAAITSGIAAVLQQQYLDRYDSLPPSSLIRGILMNTAEDLLTPGPDYISGFGNVRAIEALTVINRQTFSLSSIKSSEEKILEVDIPGNLKKVNFLLSWIDPPAIPGSEKALVHNLDFQVEDPSGQLIHPWVMAQYPDADSLLKAAYRGNDSINNQEQVTISNPKPGKYKLVVKSGNMPGEQDYALNWHSEKDSLYWTYPVKGDKLEKDRVTTVRWNQPLEMATSIEILQSGTWEMIGNIPSGSSFYDITPSGNPGVYQLRIRYGNDFLVTDSFTVSEQPRLNVGYLCDDSTLMYWNSYPSATYKISALPGNYLSDLKMIQDTVVTIKTAPDYYAVAAMYDGLEGLRSFTINPALQGIGCYVNNFLADLINDEGKLRLQLGTLTGISRVRVQKLIRNEWTTIDSSIVNTVLDYSWTDPELFAGTNTYRIEIVLGNNLLYSPVASLFFFNAKEVILYPNPLPHGGRLRVATADTDNLLVEFFDGMGRKIFSYGPVETIEQLPASKLRSGVFFYRISRNGKRIGAGRLVVQ